MKSLFVALLACACAVVLDSPAAQQCTADSGCTARPDNSAPYSVEVGVVEDVISLEDAGYRFRAYIVGWQGSRVLVSDPLAQTDRRIGDNLQFLAMRINVGARHLLAFTTAEHQARRPTLPAALHQTSNTRISTLERRGVIEEVLRAHVGAYQFVGYIVRDGDKRIALVDPSLGRTHVIGEEISFLSTRTATARRQLAGFEMIHGGAAAAYSGTILTAHLATQSGVVTDVLSAQVNGYQYRAYVVQWHDNRLLLAGSSAGTDYRVGDTLPFVAHHLKLPTLPQPHGLVQFLQRPGPTTAQEPNSAGATGSLTTENVPVTVEQVLVGKIDGDSYRAYVVNWNGLRVGVTDEFATTDYVVGEHISVPVSRVDENGYKELMFALFEFPATPSK